MSLVNQLYDQHVAKMDRTGMCIDLENLQNNLDKTCINGTAVTMLKNSYTIARRTKDATKNETCLFQDMCTLCH